MSDERTPLLESYGQDSSGGDNSEDHHIQFCRLVGTRPLDLPTGQSHTPHPDSLYRRAVYLRKKQTYTYMFTSTLTNGLILSQLVLGAALTALGASNSSHILVTIFGAMNTIIAGLIAFLKSRGQPMRARMFKDDLERVVDEIENSAVMWLGISKNIHGYDRIDTDDVTVRSEVARLTRMYDRAVKINTLNDPDMYSNGEPQDMHNAALKGPGAAAVPVAAPAAIPTSSAPVPSSAATPALAQAPVAADPDESPATKAPEPSKAKDNETPKDDKAPAKPDSKDSDAPADKGNDKDEPSKSPDSGKDKDSSTSDSKKDDEATKSDSAAQTNSASTSPPRDPDASPATAATP